MDAAVELVHSVLIILFPWGGSACSSKESCLFKHQQKKEAHSVALFSVRYGTCHCPPSSRRQSDSPSNGMIVCTLIK
jgi:hypothetical protein